MKNIAKKFLDSHPDLEKIEFIFVDFNGIPRGKNASPKTLIKAFDGGLRMPISSFVLDIWGDNPKGTGLIMTGDGDAICRPVANSLAVTPWNSRNTAQCLVSMEDGDGKAIFADPRHILSNVLDRFTKLGLRPVIAPEMEFYLVDNKLQANGHPQTPLIPGTHRRYQDVQLLNLSEMDDFEGFFTLVEKSAHSLRIPAETAIKECAPGQFEINLLHHDDALLMADQTFLLKRLIKNCARQFNMNATFMAKPFSDQAGSGTHIHISLLDRKKKNVFMGKKDKTDSPFLRHAISGLVKTMKESTAIFCPNANSYRRFQPDLYVPMAPTWGIDNRTVALRIPSGSPKSTRIEHRVAGADTNPYLTMAALLAGIHYGITQKMKPPKISTGDAIAKNPPSLPMNWAESLKEFSKGKILRKYFGKDFCHVFLETRKKEMEHFNSQITPLELDWYLRTV